MATTFKEYFYRKPLPSTCIDFASTEGKNIFKEALNEGTMDCFFNLSSQFRTQDEPAFCGLSTLVMVLNALSIDPGKVWKGPWRWYHESMLDCCLPIEVAKKEGITLFHFSCLAMCNGLDVDMVQALPTATVGEFRDAVKRASQCESQVLVCSYSRKVLGQTGNGHFSPIGGYHSERDLVLIFDVARFKYPPHWVTVDLLWKAMQAVMDPKTGQPRGYLTLRRTVHTGNPTILFKVSNNLNLNLPSKINPDISNVLQQWQTWLIAPCHNHVEKKEFLMILISKCLSLWCTECLPGLDKVFTIKLDTDCCKQLSSDHKCAICNLLRSLEQLPLFQMVSETLSSGEHSIIESWDGMVNLKMANEQLCYNQNFPQNVQIQFSHFATMMLLAWPYPSKRLSNSNVSHADFCVKYISQEMKGVTTLLEHEVKLLKGQLSTIFTYYEVVNDPEILSNQTPKSCCETTGCQKK